MKVKVTLDMEELKKRLCPKCRAAVDNFLKELAIEALQKETRKEK